LFPKIRCLVAEDFNQCGYVLVKLVLSRNLKLISISLQDVVHSPKPQASPHFSGIRSNKRIKKAENLSEKNRNAPIDGEDRHERPERVEY
jgi:hypothetical protein